jgi:hypothetical protein
MIVQFVRFTADNANFRLQLNWCQHQIAPASTVDFNLSKADAKFFELFY